MNDARMAEWQNEKMAHGYTHPNLQNPISVWNRRTLMLISLGVRTPTDQKDDGS